MTELGRRVIFLLLVTTAVIAVQCPWRLGAAENPAPNANLQTGLTLQFRSKADGPIVDSSAARLVALYVPAGSSPSPMLPPGRFTATWIGQIKTRIKLVRSFTASGRGDLLVKLNDATVLNLHGEFDSPTAAPITLNRGANKIEVIYTSPADGDAAIRLLWAEKDRPPDPIPPTYFSHDSAEPTLVNFSAIHRGRQLVASMRCLNCHSGGATAEGEMPELRQDAPNLSDVGKRLRRQWIAQWIADPKKLWPDASMPAVLHGKTQDARDIAAYLAPDSAGDDPLSGDVAGGARMFDGLGCVACHVAPGIDDSNPKLHRVPLRLVRAKYSAAALVAFLLKPHEHFAWSKMPDFHLSQAEATALGAFLWRMRIPRPRRKMGMQCAGKGFFNRLDASVATPWIPAARRNRRRPAIWPRRIGRAGAWRMIGAGLVWASILVSAPSSVIRFGVLHRRNGIRCGATRRWILRPGR